MIFDQYLDAALLGFLEAATEFLPVSSTGHLILSGHFMDFEGPPGRVFEVSIQLGAILAVCVLYFQRLFGVVRTVHSNPSSRHFVLVMALAFLPPAFIGAMFHAPIKALLFSPWVVCVALVLGGVAILWIERRIKAVRVFSIETMSYKTAITIGLIQCLSLVPGVSRSGATILGALWLGVERRVAAEFSFFQAIPLIAGAVAYDLYKNWHQIDLGDGKLIATGFITAFIGSLFVVRWMIAFVGRHGFTPFAWYRIAVGSAGLLFLALGF